MARRSKDAKPIKTIRVDLVGSTVDFEGVWRRSDLDVAYRLMLKKLGSHYAGLRAEARAAVEPLTESEPPSSDEEGATNELEG